MKPAARPIQINGRSIGRGYPTYIVAEVSANHNHNFDKAVAILNAAKAAGADAVKLQTYRPDTITIDCDNEYFQIKGTIWNGRKLYDLYAEAYTPWEWQPKLKEIADELALDFFSTPFDATAVHFLEDMEVPAYKVASFENVDLLLLSEILETGKPIIMSTGMATLAEIDEAVTMIRRTEGSQLALLKCTSAYPARPEEMNLCTIPHLEEAFDLPVGVSDHTLGVAIPASAVTLGACIVEKHLTLSRRTPGPDSAFSLEPEEFKAMVESVRITEKALGRVQYGAAQGETASRGFRRSLFIVEDIHAGEKFSAVNIRSIRPGYGLHTRYYEKIIGRCASKDLKRGTPLSWDLVSGE